jgi:hypothetical protein
MWFVLFINILFVSSQGAYNLFPTKMNTISKSNEWIKGKKLN